MAKRKARKSAPRKRTSARSRAATAVARPRRRSNGGNVGVGLKPLDIVMAIGGAVLVEKYADKLKIQDPRMRYGAIAAGAALVAWKVPQAKALRPLLIGAAVMGGVKAASAAFPDLLKKTGTVKVGADTNVKSIGRRTDQQYRAIQEGVERNMGRMRGLGSGTGFAAMQGRFGMNAIQGPRMAVMQGRYTYSR